VVVEDDLHLEAAVFQVSLLEYTARVRLLVVPYTEAVDCMPLPALLVVVGAVAEAMHLPYLKRRVMLYKIYQQ
jgi:hypothetical protein